MTKETPHTQRPTSPKASQKPAVQRHRHTWPVSITQCKGRYRSQRRGLILPAEKKETPPLFLEHLLREPVSSLTL